MLFRSKLDGTGGWGGGRTQWTLALHNGLVNWLFADGHVSVYQITDPKIYNTGTPASPKGFWTVNAGD